MPRSGVFKARRANAPLWSPPGEKTITVNPLQSTVSPDTSFWDANEDYQYSRAAGHFIPQDRLDRLIWKLHQSGQTNSQISEQIPALTGKQVWGRLQAIISQMTNSLSVE